MYYKRYELQWRLTLFFTASIIAGAFGGVRRLALHKRISLMLSSCWLLRLQKWMGLQATAAGGNVHLSTSMVGY